MFKPVKVELEAGKQYSFCTCGKGVDGVLCNGSHKGTEFTPMKFFVEESKTYPLCTCKKSSNLPFCDGTHRKL